MAQTEKFMGVIGAGAWGMALALAFHRAGHHVCVWGRNHTFMESLQTSGMHPKLPQSIRLPESLQLTSDISHILKASILVSAIPTQQFRSAFTPFSGFLRAGIPLIQTAKGIEYETGLLLPDVMNEVAPQAKAFMLSGPSFADDVAQGLPTAVTLACGEGMATCESIAPWFQGSVLRPYLSNDIRGVALAGAFKNVVAIACGITIGAKLGESARASVAARGFAEMRRLNKALGGRDETVMGLAGMGDLMLTSSSVLSRNYRFGLTVGAGCDAQTGQGGETIEGVATTQALERWSGDLGVELPLTHHVSRLLSGKITLQKAIDALLSRPFRHER